MADLKTYLAFYTATCSKGYDLESLEWGFAFGISSKATWTSKRAIVFFCTVQMEDNTLIISYNVWLLVRSGVTVLNFGKFYHGLIWRLDNKGWPKIRECSTYGTRERKERKLQRKGGAFLEFGKLVWVLRGMNEWVIHWFVICFLSSE